MSETVTSWEECAEFMNRALGPIDDAGRTMRLMGHVARGLGDTEVVDELISRIETVQHEVAMIRARFDELAGQ